MPRSTPSLLSLALLCALGSACSRQDVEAPSTRGAVLSGVMVDAQLAEISGLAASRRHKGVLWMHDDGGNPARLFAVDADGSRLATLRVETVPKTDWEDMAAFRLDGRDYLLLADTGDNGGLRHTLQLHVLEEPARVENARLKPAWSITFRWPDGPRDCEAVAVDAKFGQVLLISKKRQPPELFSLPLRPGTTQVQTARRVTTLSGVPQPDAQELRRDPQARELRRITAADLSPNGRTLAVMNYRDLLLYDRRAGEGWAEALARAPRVQVLPLLPQAEALGWAADGKSLYATSEFVPAPLYRITP